jgi:hypothetical protein
VLLKEEATQHTCALSSLQPFKKAEGGANPADLLMSLGGHDQ